MVTRAIDGELSGLGELDGELEYEGEEELDGEEFLGTVGTIARGIGGLLGEGEDELEGEYEGEYEFELDGEYESEEFFKKIGRFLRKAAPVLKNVARVAAPIVGTAVGGPLGGIIGRAAGTLLREGEYEFELDGEFEDEFETDLAMEADGPITSQQALAEFMAAVASRAQTDVEAEAMAGAATMTTISPADRAALRTVLPHMVRGTAVLTRILRRRAVTRPVVRAVPTIVRRTAKVLKQRAEAGQPVTRRTAAKAMAAQTRRVLASPRTCAHAIQRNVRATRAVAKQRRRPVMAGAR